MNFFERFSSRSAKAFQHSAEEIDVIYKSPLLDLAWYRQKYPDLRDRPIDLARHYFESGAVEGRDPHPLFSTKYYLEQNPDVAARGENPLLHFIFYGIQKGTSPNPFFDTRWYLDTNPDVKACNMNPLVHYALHGAREGRDPSPNFSTEWYVSEYLAGNPDGINPLAHYLHYGQILGNTPKPNLSTSSGVDLKRLHLRKLDVRLRAFLASSKRLSFSRSEMPLVSIVLVLFNKAEFTFACLESLYVSLVDAPFAYQLIVFDNGSSDLTHGLLNRCDNLVLHESDSNLGYLRGVNFASELARGEFLLFLNNDTEVPHGTLEKALTVISGDDTIGAVGSRLILPNGTLQEAGSIVWRDGSCLGYCRGRDPDYYPANFRRNVDYCSAAFLLTRTTLFGQLGRFNPIYEPAYYEETDYCLRLWENGLRVVYDPSLTVFHFEFASASTVTEATGLQETNQKKFKKAHEAALATHYAPDRRNVLFARHAGKRKTRLLIVDDRVPHPHLGSGFPRAKMIVEQFLSLGAQVTFCPTDDEFSSWETVRETFEPAIEVAFGVRRDGLVTFIRSRLGFYDAIFVSRPHNMRPINDALEEEPGLLNDCQLIYDAEALFTDREITLRRLRGSAASEEEREQLLREEIGITRFASTVLCVSQNDQKQLLRFKTDVRVLGHALTASPTPPPFDDRNDILFVGAVHTDDSPNADSLIWFVDDILPRLRTKIQARFKFLIAGLNKSEAVAKRIRDDVIGFGAINDLTPLYEQGRVFVAPTRIAAGIPHKVHEAAARGIPCVVTSVLAEQLGWCNGEEVLVASDAEGFANACAALYTDRNTWVGVRESALRAVERDCDPRAFAGTLRTIYSELCPSDGRQQAAGRKSAQAGEILQRNLGD